MTALRVQRYNEGMETNKKNIKRKLSLAKKSIGATKTYQINGLRFPVKVTDVRPFSDRVQYLIVPVAGAGKQWVETFKKLTNLHKKAK